MTVLFVFVGNPRVPCGLIIRYLTDLLLALANGERHGYELMKQVNQDSRGQVRMGSGTLYGSIKRMLAAGLIAEAGERPDPTVEDERRRHYRLTALGRDALLSELQRYDTVVSLAHQRRLIREPEVEGSQ